MKHRAQTKTPSKLIPAASVVIVNDDGTGPRALLVHRNPELSLQGDMWAFPGGHVDTEDRVTSDDLETARRCAVREVAEETGLRLTPGDLIHMARWISPAYLPRRFDSWFFLIAGTFKDVRVDGQEIIEHAWYRPHQALSDHNHHKMRLTPPAFVLLSRIAGFDSLGTIRRWAQTIGVLYFEGRSVRLTDGQCVLYPGDEAYEDADLNRPGPRNRLWMRASGWRHEHSL